jgi:hypothetical protein
MSPAWRAGSDSKEIMVSGLPVQCLAELGFQFLRHGFMLGARRVAVPGSAGIMTDRRQLDLGTVEAGDDFLKIGVQDGSFGRFAGRVVDHGRIGAEKHKVMINNSTLLIDPVHGETSWEKFIVFPKAEQWTDLDLGLINLKEGDNYIKFISGGHGAIAVDCFIVEPMTPRN